MSATIRRLVPLLLAPFALEISGCNQDQGPTDSSAESSQLQATAGRYTFHDIGTLGGNSAQANDINGSGSAIVGWSLTASGAQHAFLWKNGMMTDLGTFSGKRSEATAINDDGVVVGTATNLAEAPRAVRWKDGRKRNLGTLGGNESHALDINASGVIVGWSTNAAGARRAFIWKDGVMRDIGTLGGSRAVATGINGSEVVVGWSTTATSGDKPHAFRWRGGVMKDLGTMEGNHSDATAINGSGQIVGSFGPPPDAEGSEEDQTTAFEWHQGVTTKIVGGFPAFASDINAFGIIVGHDDLTHFDGLADNGNAWVWESGTFTLLPEPEGTTGHGFSHVFTAAEGINRSGHIVGYYMKSCTADDGCSPTRAALWRRS